MNTVAGKKQQRVRRRARIRAKIAGTPERPRFAVSRSNRYVAGQLIDDESGTSLAQINAGTLKDAKDKGQMAQADMVGRALAKKAIELGISRVVFDRGGYQYTGVVKAIADGARAEGLTF